MNDTISVIEDLYRYNDWANGRVFELCRDLPNEQMDAPREIGFGSLRNTLFHILTAEQIWLERWQVVPWRPFPTDSQGMSLEDIEHQLKQIAQARQQMISSERPTKWQRVVTYKDSRSDEYSHPLDILLVHVANHSTYHRAQALNCLKHFGRTIPVGIDYSLYKLARPTVEQETDSIAAFRNYGLEVATGPGYNVRWDQTHFERYLAYHDWANREILNALDGADDAVLDREFPIGPGSIRKVLMHAVDVELWLWMLWHDGNEKPPQSQGMSVEELWSAFKKLEEQRAPFVAGLDAKTSQRVVTGAPGGIPFKSRVSESLLQICCHGTHHRAQVVNMLRHSALKIPDVDMLDWWCTKKLGQSQPED